MCAQARMTLAETSLTGWAREELGSADLRHRRRTWRAVAMLTRMAERPSGSVLDVFDTSAERQGAYDFLENSAIRPEALLASIAEATAMRARTEPYVFVAVDGSSLTLTDHARRKDFGAVGTTLAGARGLKMINAYAVSPKGVPLGVTAQVWWSRVAHNKRGDHQARRLGDKETRHWVEAIDRTCETMERIAPETRAWFQLDREADGVHTLRALDRTGHFFTVRSGHDRRLTRAHGAARGYLRPTLGRERCRGHYDLSVSPAPGRRARIARMVVRFADVTLRMRDKATGRATELTLTAVSARESRTVPRGEKRLEWTLLTHRPVQSFEDAYRVVYGYALRWRIEELHRTWKSGACDVERSQLRKKDHIVKWATLMVAVASRIERLKVLSRTEPERPASDELTPHEIKALVLTRRRTKKRTDPEPSPRPTLGEAVRWVADIGGYTGPKVSGGPPGAVTIRRGLEKVIPVALALELLEREGLLR
ncbi:MAG: IS4 family transposase [Proteobacteria bacterium]|nr:MAG: IS4 family transposase [Pseudomonadota bacterium]